MTVRHYDLDVLADLAEGLLDDETTTAVRGHLEACARCASQVPDPTEMNDVTRVLAAAPLPPLPTSLVARLDAALLAEATRGAPAHVVDLAERRRMKASRMARLVSVAAAAVVVSGVGALAIANGAFDDTDARDLQNVATPPTPARTAESVDASGRDYSAKDLDGSIAGTVRVKGEAVRPLTDDQRACLNKTVPADESILFVDVAKYEGTPAMIIYAGGAVYVTGSTCDLIAHTPAG
ncbi:hypothetical protein GCM10022221_44990 [Actinocorallia aurea]